MNACSRNGYLGHTVRGITQVNWPAYGSVGMFEPFTPAGKNLALPPQREGITRSLKQTDDVVAGGRSPISLRLRIAYRSSIEPNSRGPILDRPTGDRHDVVAGFGWKLMAAGEKIVHPL